MPQSTATEDRRDGTGLLDEVRASCAWLAGRARFVRLAGNPLDYARRLWEESSPAAPAVARDPAVEDAGRVAGEEVEWDEQTHFKGGDEETVAFVVTLDAINFGSGYFPHLRKKPGLSGYFTVASALKERFDAEGPFSARELRELDPAWVARLLGQPAGDPVRDELMGHFSRALQDLGEFLTDRFGGSFGQLLAACHGSAERLAGLLTAMPYFRDIARYQDRQIPLLKRAQITPSDLALALQPGHERLFRDLDRLTIFADNLVPHVLRLDGVLEYEAGLVERLEQGHLLEPGSAEEVEIRAVALHAVERMVDGLRVDGAPASARQFDLLLWNRGQEERYRGGSKHRTRTVYY